MGGKATMTRHMTKPSHGTIETQNGTNAPVPGRNIELVFRTVGERTSEKALELALKHIQPNRVHILSDCKPFTHAVERMLTIPHECSHVVYVDADCFILEDMRPFLDANELPYTDAYVTDRFRGRVTCGVHITRRDVVEKMQRNVNRFRNEAEYLLRPESFLRNVALAELGFTVQLKNFNILHDYLQSYTDIFIKYVIRYLRSRIDDKHFSLTEASEKSSTSDDALTAEAALRFVSEAFPHDIRSDEVRQLFSTLPDIAQKHIEKLGLTQQRAISSKEIGRLFDEFSHRISQKHTQKVFGIGLSRTGALSLTIALHELGFDTVHFPTDIKTLETLKRNDAQFPLLNHYDGITGITTVPFYQELDKLYPGSKFILTVRDEASWLRSCYIHWSKETDNIELSATRNEITKILHEQIYGSSHFEWERYITIYRQHIADVMEYFKDREQDLLVLNIISGEGYEKLTKFLNVKVPDHPFPHRNISTLRSSPEHKWKQLAQMQAGIKKI
jgi:hypothetical protein